MRKNLITEMKSSDAWDRIYSDVKKYPALEGDVKIFDRLNNLYTKEGDNFNMGIFNWIYKMFENGDIGEWNMDEAEKAIKKFQKFKHRIEVKDIGVYNNLDELIGIVSVFGEGDPISKKEMKKRAFKEGVEKIYESDNWKIYIPRTPEGSKIVGKHTTWCTAGECDNRFEEYYEVGPMYVLVDKNYNEKYQLQFERDRFRDELNRQIDLKKFFLENRELFHFFVKNTPYGKKIMWFFRYCDFDREFYDLFDSFDYKEKSLILERMRECDNDEAIEFGFLNEPNISSISIKNVFDICAYKSEDFFLKIFEHLISKGYETQFKYNYELTDEYSYFPNLLNCLRNKSDYTLRKYGFMYERDPKNIKDSQIDAYFEYYDFYSAEDILYDKYEVFVHLAKIGYKPEIFKKMYDVDKILGGDYKTPRGDDFIIIGLNELGSDKMFQVRYKDEVSYMDYNDIMNIFKDDRSAKERLGDKIGAGGSRIIYPKDMTENLSESKITSIVKRLYGGIDEKWSKKYKRSIDCNNPKGFSQRAHCQGRLKEDIRYGETLLTEALHEIDSDVDFIYDKFFKEDIDEIKKTGIVRKNQFQPAEFHTSELKNPICIEANELNPCRIIINNFKYSNSYDPINDVLYFSINDSAFNFVVDDGGNIDNAKNSLPYSTFKRLKQEFTEEKLKGNIHHELTHWIDDTFRKRSVKSWLQKRIKHNTNNLYGKDAYMHYIEINAMMHNIKQIHRIHKDIWDELNFSDLFILYPAFHGIYKRLPPDHKKEWTRKLKERMYREGLLGKNMKYSQ
jgi:hypothetical protein